MDSPTKEVTGRTDEEKELPTWVPDEDIPQIPDLENIFDGPWDSGWDQFEISETLLGVQSNFGEELYTTKLVRGPEMRELEKEAMRRAIEIEREKTRDLQVTEERGIDMGENINIVEETQVSSVPRGILLDKSRSEEEEDISWDSHHTELIGGKSNDGPRVSSSASPVGRGIDTHENFDIAEETRSSPDSRGKSLDNSGFEEKEDLSLDLCNAETVGASDIPFGRFTELSGVESNDGAKASSGFSSMVVSVSMDSPTNEVQGETDEDIVVDSLTDTFPHKEEKELPSWVPDEDIPQIPDLENIFDGPWDRGWDQFEINETLLGVKSNFDEELYTTKLVRRREMRQLEEEAMRRAREIEREETRDLQVVEERGIDMLENIDIDEETQVSSVPRDISLDKSCSEEEEDISGDSHHTVLSGGESNHGAKISSDSLSVERGIDMRENVNIDKETRASSVSRGKSFVISGRVEDDTTLDSCNAETVGAYDTPGRPTYLSGGESDDGARISSSSSLVERGIDMRENIDIDEETRVSSVYRGKSLSTSVSVEEDNIPLDSCNDEIVGAYDTPSGRSTQFIGEKSNDGARISSCSSPVQSGIVYEDINDEETQFILVSRKSRKNRVSVGAYSTHSSRFFEWRGGKSNDGARIFSGSSSMRKGIIREKFGDQDTRFPSVSRGKSGMAKTLGGGYGTHSSRSTTLSGGKINDGEKISSGSSSVGLPRPPPLSACFGSVNKQEDRGNTIKENNKQVKEIHPSKSEGKKLVLQYIPKEKLSDSLSSLDIKKGSSDKAPASASHVLSKNQGKGDSSIESYGKPEALKSIGRSDPPASSSVGTSAVVGVVSSKRSTLNPNAPEFEFHPNGSSSIPSESPVSDVPRTPEMVGGIGIAHPFAGDQSAEFIHQLPQMQLPPRTFYPPLYAQAIDQQMQPLRQTFYPPLYAQALAQQMQPPLQTFYPPLYAQALAQEMRPPQQPYPTQFPQMQIPPHAYVLAYGRIIPGYYCHSLSRPGSQPVLMCSLGNFLPRGPPSPPPPAPP